MIPRTLIGVQTPSWQHVLADMITDPQELSEILNIDLKVIEHIEHFPLRATRPYVNRIEKNNLNDPLLKQILPIHEELTSVAGYSTDPLEEIISNTQPGIVHKYQGRVLLIVTGSCAIHCRYCFRRHFPYQENNLNTQQWQQSLDHIRHDSDIKEVILSGGDPLAVNDKRLSWLVEQISAIDHIERLRIHTRLPVVIPQRINDELLTWLTSTRLKPVVVVHVNHSNEIDQQVMLAIEKLINNNITVLNQSVLLKGINDSTEALVNLSETLFNCGILPYYLHLLDPVSGAAHFNVSELSANKLMTTIKHRLPGYLVPKLVREIPGELAKSVIA